MTEPSGQIESLATIQTPRAADLVAPVSAPTQAAIPTHVLPAGRASAAATQATPAPRAATPDRAPVAVVGTVQSVPAPFSTSGPASPVEAAMGWAVFAAVRRLGQPDTLPAPAATVSTGQAVAPAATVSAKALFANPFIPVMKQVIVTIVKVVVPVRTVINNSRPMLSPVPKDVRETASGVISGYLNGFDFDNDPMTFKLEDGAKHGTVTLYDRFFVYTPNADLAHTGGTDTFWASVSDENADSHVHLYGTTGHSSQPQEITVKVSPHNIGPAWLGYTQTAADESTGEVIGSITAFDAEKDKLVLSVTPSKTWILGAKGRVNLTPPPPPFSYIDDDGVLIDWNTGKPVPLRFSFIPTPEARHQAAKVSAKPEDKVDRVDVTVDDGHGGTVTRTMVIEISPLNTAPTGSFKIRTTNDKTGVVTGRVKATDTNGDPLTYTLTSAPSNGDVKVGADGVFTYTPTPAGRHIASRPSNADLKDTFTVTVTDGYGGSTPVSVAVQLVKNDVNSAPSAQYEIKAVDRSTGVVTGRVVATDADNDPLTYVVSSAPAKGDVKLAADGGFTYTPGDAARHIALKSDLTDTFEVTVSDGDRAH